MKKAALLLFTTILFLFTKAQFYYYNNRYYECAVVGELGSSFGLMNSFTDLGGRKGIGRNFIKDLTWKTARPSFSLYGMAMYKNAIGLRLEATFGSVVGYDSILKNSANSYAGRYERNLSFKSKIVDIQLAAEIHPLFFKLNDDAIPKFSPYAVIGIGYYSFDPKANLNGRWYSLQPLRTEGQGFNEYRERKPYKLHQFNVATGIGVRYELSSWFNLRLETTHRFLNTDYLDDVSTTYIDPNLFAQYLPASFASAAKKLYNRKAEINPADGTVPGSQRGDPNDKDTFFTIQLKIGVIVGRLRR